jgi:hypothetical protein
MSPGGAGWDGPTSLAKAKLVIRVVGTQIVINGTGLQEEICTGPTITEGI